MPKTQHTTHPTSFRGFQNPNFTPVPDELFDELLVDLSGAELKVLLYIIRRTFGFKKERDNISLAQMLHGITTKDGRVLDRGVGLSKPTLLQALRSLQERHVIETERRRSSERGDEPTAYKLNLLNTRPAEDTPVVKKLYQGVVKKSTPPVVKKSTSQYTVIQQTDIQHSNIRMVETEKDNDAHRKQDDSPPLPPAPLRTVVEPVTRTAIQSTNGMEHVGQSLQQRLGFAVSRPSDTDAKEAITAYIRDIASRLHDEAPLKSSVTRACNLYSRSGGHLGRFLNLLRDAENEVYRRRSTITGRKTAYFFAILEDLLGFREQPLSPSG